MLCFILAKEQAPTWTKWGKRSFLAFFSFPPPFLQFYIFSLLIHLQAAISAFPFQNTSYLENNLNFIFNCQKKTGLSDFCLKYYMSSVHTLGRIFLERVRISLSQI